MMLIEDDGGGVVCGCTFPTLCSYIQMKDYLEALSLVEEEKVAIGNAIVPLPMKHKSRVLKTELRNIGFIR